MLGLVESPPGGSLANHVFLKINIKQLFIRVSKFHIKQLFIRVSKINIKELFIRVSKN